MKSKKKIIIFSIVVAVIAVIMLFSAVYFLTDIFKTPKQLFFKYLGKQIPMETSLDYNDMLETIEKTKNKSYDSNMNLKLNVESKGINYLTNSSSDEYEFINKMDYRLEQTVNPNENKSYNKLNIGYDGKGLGTVELVQNNDIYALKSDYIYGDKYIAIENNNLKEFMKKIGLDSDIIEAMPDKIEQIDMYDLLYISEKDQKSIKETYLKFIDKNIKNSNIKIENNAEITINGENKRATKYTLTLNEKEMLNIAINFMNTLKSDEITLDIIVDKYNKCVNNSFTEINRNSYKNNKDLTITKEELIEDIEDTIEKLRNELDNASESSSISISVYQNRGKTCRTEFLSKEDKIIIDNYIADGKNYIEMIIPTEKVSSYSSRTYKRQKTKVQNKIKIEYTLDEQTDKTVLNGKIRITEETEEKAKVKFNIEAKGKNKSDKNELNMEISIENDDIAVGAKLENSLEFKNNVDIEELDNNNIIKLNDMNNDEITNIMKDISNNFQTKMKNVVKELGLED